MVDADRMRLAEIGCATLTGRPLSEILEKFAVSERARSLFIEGFAELGEAIEEADAAGRVPSSARSDSAAGV